MTKENPREIEVTPDLQTVSVVVPEIVGDKVIGRSLKRFNAVPNGEHEGHLLFQEVSPENPDQPAEFYKRIYSKLNLDYIVPDIVKGERGRKALKYLGAISAAVAIEEAIRRGFKARRK